MAKKDGFQTLLEEPPVFDEETELILIEPKPSRRLLAELADICLCGILSMLLFFGFKPLYGYDGYASRYTENSETMMEVSKDSYLVAVDEEGSNLSATQLRSNYITCLLSYYEDRSASTANDYLANYYCVYVPDDGVSTGPLMDFAAFNYEILGIGNEENEYGDLFAYQLDENGNEVKNVRGVLSLSAYEATLASQAGGADDLSLSTYTRLQNFYTAAHDAAWEGFITSEPYYSLLVEDLSLLSSIRYVYLFAALSSYVSSCLLVFLLVPMIKLTGTGIGKKVLRLSFSHQDGSRLKWYEILTRSLVETIEYMFLIPFSGFLSVGISLFSLPMFNLFGTDFTISVLVVAGLILTLVSTFMVFFTKKGQCLHDLAGNGFVYDADPSHIATERNRRSKLKGDEYGER